MSGSPKRLRRACLLAALTALGACTGTMPDRPALCPPRSDSGNIVYVVARGWHVELGLPADRLDGPLAVYRDIFPGARVVMFGYGKRTFITAPADSLTEYVLGPVPGPAAIQASGLAGSPLDGYPPGTVETLTLPPGGAEALSVFIGGDLARDSAGNPQLLGPGPFPGSLFYGARSGYSLAHTCNTWAADALHAAGLPVSGAGVVLSGQVVSRVGHVGATQCLAAAAARTGHAAADSSAQR